MHLFVTSKDKMINMTSENQKRVYKGKEQSGIAKSQLTFWLYNKMRV